MIPLHSALREVFRRVNPLGKVTVPLEEALGCCLAEDIRADRNLPPANRSAMDGYAVRAADLAQAPCRLRFVGEVAAGSSPREEVGPGTCIRIFTGANIPPGADAVAIVEQTSEENGDVSFLSKVKPGANILKKAEDAVKGKLLLPCGTILGPMQIGVCATVGKPHLQVYRRPKVAVICTGAELRKADEAVASHEVRNSNGPTLRAALEMWGFPGACVHTVPDDPGAITNTIVTCANENHVVLICGGVSKGRYDFVPDAVKAAGGAVHFHGVSIKPGKPLLYADMPKGKHIFGLPGNPLSVSVCFNEFVLPALRHLSGIDEKRCRPSMRVPLASKVVSKGGRTRFFLAQLLRGSEGLMANPVLSHSSADLVAGGLADGAFSVPSGTVELKQGTVVEFRAWRPLS